MGLPPRLLRHIPRLTNPAPEPPVSQRYPREPGPPAGAESVRIPACPLLLRARGPCKDQAGALPAGPGPTSLPESWGRVAILAGRWGASLAQGTAPTSPLPPWASGRGASSQLPQSETRRGPESWCPFPDFTTSEGLPASSESPVPGLRGLGSSSGLVGISKGHSRVPRGSDSPGQ